MTRWLAAWDDFFHAPAGGQRMAAVRILLAAFLLVYFGQMAAHVPLLFSNQGVYVPYLVPDYAPPPTLAWLLFTAMMATTVSLLLGYRASTSAALLLGLFLYHYFLALAVKQSTFDRLIVVDLLALCFASAGHVFGLDARRPGPQPTRWAERLLAMQTVALYFGAGLWKAFNPAWLDGTLLHATLQGMWATPLAFAIVRADLPQPAWAALSWLIIALELSLGPLLLLRRTRPLALALGVCFHGLNCVVLVVPEFLVCIAVYPVFMSERTLQRMFDGVARAAAGIRRSWPRVRSV